ncbi:hypothetical protein [Streptomyces camelliae]|uniref:Uncharacterized protein n=1 Tax=Streptomyces camelliae TaxID=3004093 RepID=A0ABY7NY96_9ACTN|nr:hypothetical protein [Streptomyces sp. HUAS 2-6]WBO63204.1 hypothetical protein O1G22_10355 [Streptomyces sp. HUAS 2-6]
MRMSSRPVSSAASVWSARVRRASHAGAVLEAAGAQAEQVGQLRADLRARAASRDTITPTTGSSTAVSMSAEALMSKGRPGRPSGPAGP